MRPAKFVAENILRFFLFFFQWKTLDISYELPAKQMIHKKCLTVFFWKKKKKKKSMLSAAVVIATLRAILLGNNQYKAR